MRRPRLVAEVFRVAGAPGHEVISQAVRAPQTELERSSWQQFRTDLIELRPEDFARRVASEPPR